MAKKNIAIITGANSGFGKEFVKLLISDSEVDEIWAVARNVERLNELKNEFGDKINPLSLDLSDRKSIDILSDKLKESNVSIKYLINNAGYAKFCSYDDISVEESLNMIDLNIGAVVSLGLLCIPYMEEGSHIMNIASQASFFPLPYMNIYSSTKVFVRNYTRALNVELKDKGISATAVCPGWMRTNLFDRGSIGAKKSIRNFIGIVSPDVVAKRALKDARKNKDISTYGALVKSTRVLAKILPQRAIMDLWVRMQKNK